MRKKIFLLFSVLIFSCNKNLDWPIYGGSNERTQYVKSDLINKGNISRLNKVWEYKTNDHSANSEIQTNSLIIDKKFFGVSPKLKLFSLNAKTGHENWVFDPFSENFKFFDSDINIHVCRGITYYKNLSNNSFIFYGVGSKLFKINTINGKPDKEFGNGGFIDLHVGLGENSSSLYVSMTSPGVIFKNLIIVGSRVSEGNPAAKGNIRAFNANTGELVWVFKTIPEPEEKGYESYEDPNAYLRLGGANAWSGLTIDSKNGILFAPTGSVSYDFYGGDRKGDNLFANSILAINAENGERLWHYQTVHHDVWDRDLPAPPVIFNYKLKDSVIPALAQVTKSGYTFLLNRITGEPIYDIVERTVPSVSSLTGEKLSKTQPTPTFPKPFSRQYLSNSDINPFVSEKEKDSLTKVYLSIIKDDIFSPPSEKGTLIFPGFDGGAEWGGPALDPIKNMLYVNSNEMPWILTMRKISENDSKPVSLYNKQCLMCHGVDFKGSGENPSIIDMNKKYNYNELRSIIYNGKGFMPGYSFLDDSSIQVLTNYILDLKDGDKTNLSLMGDEVFYTSTGYNKFLTSNGYPAIKPPWGSLNAINLNTGDIDWSIPLGQTEIGKLNNVTTGTENYGGPLLTESGIIFIAATSDRKIRAFDSENGRLIWERDLPYAGFATPSYYVIDGIPYLSIASGGGKLGTRSGDRYVVFSLK